MEENKDNQLTINYNDIYLRKAINYGGKGFVIGGITSLLLLSKIKYGAIIGLGIGLGYCNDELMDIYYNANRFIYAKDK